MKKHTLHTNTKIKASKTLKKLKEVIKMCLNLIGSQYENISEVEYLLNKGFNMTEEKILKMKNNRNEIERALKVAKQNEELLLLGL